MSNHSFFHDGVATTDPALFASLQGEWHRQQQQIELIPSENLTSRAVLQAQGSVLTNKYAEGYPGKRYYGGNDQVDIAESLAIQRACALFGCGYANVQPHSGAQANQAVMLALLQPGDAFLGLSLAAGGHLTHGSPVNLSGKWFAAHSYGVHPDTHLIDYDVLAEQAQQVRPKVLIAGGSAYPRALDFPRLRQIADAAGALLWVDMAHFAGLVAGGVYPSPLPHAQIVTTTTHKTLRGPRGGLILTNEAELAKKFNSAVFPGLQGGPLMHVIAAKAVAFAEALRPEFHSYAAAIIAHNRAMGAVLAARGYPLIAGGTDSNLLLVDLRAAGITGAAAQDSLDRAGLTLNKNMVPFDPLPPAKTSGIRLGSPAATTRGLGLAEFTQVGTLIADVLDGLRARADDQPQVEQTARQQVAAICARFPIYGGPF